MTTGVVAAAMAFGLAQSSARADFTETFCDGTASAPWINGAGGGSPWGGAIDSCGTSGGAYSWDDGTATLGYGVNSAAIEAPAGEVFTAASYDYSAEPYTGNAASAYVLFGYGTDTTDGQIEVPSGGVSTTQSVTLPETTEVWLQYFCAAQSGGSCDESSWQGVLGVSRMSITIRDTGSPAVAATGGSLDAQGATLKGTQTLLYHATDTGSGVDTVSLSLGSSVLATDQSPCQAASLTPCPASVPGSFSVNTAAVPDGTYPVILTVSDVSGDAVPVQVGMVTIDNAVGTTTVRASGRGRRAIHTKVVFDWDPRAASTRMIWTHFGRLPRRARVVLRCTGHRCPFRLLRGTARRIRTLERDLRHRSFHAGDRLTLTITAPRRTPETGTELIRSHRRPVTVRTRR